MLDSVAPIVPVLPSRRAALSIVVLSPYRLVPLALRAAGRQEQAFEVAGTATGPESALAAIAETHADVLVFDPTALSLGRIARLIREAGQILPSAANMVVFLEPAQAATMVAARFAFTCGVRSVTTAFDQPDSWPVAVHAAARGAAYISPFTFELFGAPIDLPAVREEPWGPTREWHSAARYPAESVCR